MNLRYHLQQILVIAGLLICIVLVARIVVLQEISLSESQVFSDLSVIFCIGLFVHLHYELAFKSFLLQRRWLKYFSLLSLLLVSVSLLLECFVTHSGYSLSTVAFESLILCSVAFVYAMIMTHLAYRTKRAHYEKTLSEMRLKVLQSQIHPHFLFNTLNSIYSASLQENAMQTSMLVEKFSNLLRYSTASQNGLIGLHEEMAFLQDYIELQRSRMPDNQLVEVDVVIDECQQYHIRSILLLPFIENAFKFGLESSGPTKIIIRVVLKQGKLSLFVQNDVYDHNRAFQSPGIGINNTHSRLEEFYPGKYKLVYGSRDNVYTVSLEINLAP